MAINAALFVSLMALFGDARQIARLLEENQVPAVGIAVIRDGALRQVEVHGELRKGVPAPYDAVFNVASLTKPVVAVLTLKLVALGKWQLDEPLAKYWVDPDVAADPRHRLLTTRHVLSHQTGFANWRWEERSKRLTFRSAPGTEFGYSGEGFEYLRRALERKFKRSLAQLARTYVLAPLGMTHTTTASAADDLLTTVEDYGRFAAHVLNGAGLPPPLFAEMVEPQVAMKKGGASMGLGWEVHQGLRGGEYALIHSGADHDVHTVVILLPKSKQGLVIFTNGDNGYKLYGPIVTELLDVGRELMERAR